MNEYINILGVNINSNTKKKILKTIVSFLYDEKKHYVVTPNPEFLLAAQKDEEFFYILNKADIAVPDGIGLSFAGLLMGKIIKRIAGIDLMLDICKIAEQHHQTVFLLGGAPDIARQAQTVLKNKYPNLNIVGASSGLNNNEWGITGGIWTKGKKLNNELIARINQAEPDIIFVAFGHAKQEKWIYHSLPHLSSVKLAMGVGGSFDFIGGHIKRAPKIFKILALEWLWRLIQEPRKRWRRIYNAVIKFPLIFSHWFFIEPWLYRSNVACLLYKKDHDKIYVLLAERRSEKGHWQLPQGGTDGESLEKAGTRELQEEIGTDKFKPKATFPDLYYYSFAQEISKHYSGRKKGGYKGQKQGLFIAEFLGRDSDITINYWDHRDWQWVELAKVTETVHNIRKKATNIFINKFNNLI